MQFWKTLGRLSLKKKSSKETLVSGEGFANEGDMERLYEAMHRKDVMNDNQENMDMEEEGDYSSFSIVEEVNYGRPCPNFFISKKEDDIMCKPWQKL